MRGKNMTSPEFLERVLVFVFYLSFFLCYLTLLLNCIYLTAFKS